ncbi:MAG: type II secretion system minor pseudopilin GspK, partial [Pseudomonadota bacterium]
MPQQQHASQAGTALLSVLLLLSVVSALMVALLDEMLLSLNVSQNAQDSLLARYQATAAEALALNELEALLARNSGSLANVGNWNGKPLPVALDRGRMTVTISDYTACFNLNALVSSRAQRAGLTPRQSGLGTWPSAAEPRRTSLTMQRQFIALLEALEFSRGEAQRITAAIVDWLDSDRIAVSLGAEDGSYSAARGGYRTANQLLRSVTELLDIRGITPDIYARLAPSMCAHPSTKPAPI